MMKRRVVIILLVIFSVKSMQDMALLVIKQLPDYCIQRIGEYCTAPQKLDLLYHYVHNREKIKVISPVIKSIISTLPNEEKILAAHCVLTKSKRLYDTHKKTLKELIITTFQPEKLFKREKGGYFEVQGSFDNFIAQLEKIKEWFVIPHFQWERLKKICSEGAQEEEENKRYYERGSYLEGKKEWEGFGLLIQEMDYLHNFLPRTYGVLVRTEVDPQGINNKITLVSTSGEKGPVELESYVEKRLKEKLFIPDVADNSYDNFDDNQDNDGCA